MVLGKRIAPPCPRPTRVTGGAMRGAIKVYRKELEWERDMPDQAARLYKIYRMEVDWDKKHIHTFGTAHLPIREIKRKYLPYWSIGKISQWRRWLITSGCLKVMENKKLAVTNYKYFSLPIREAEREFQKFELNFQTTEHNVQPNEKPLEKITALAAAKNLKILPKNTDNVQGNEHTESSKENLENIKEEIKNIVSRASKKEI